MLWKMFGGVVAVVLVLGYVGPVVIRVADPALVVVVLIGVGLMLADLWQSLQSKDD
jgi:hypothetical protein